MKKTLTMLLCLTLLLSLLPAVPVLAQTHPYDYLFYTVEDGNAVIVDCDVEFGDDLIIPDTLDGYPVTEISETAFVQCSGFGRVTIPHSVISIAPTALYECFIDNGIWVDENNPVYSSDEFGVLFNKDKTVLVKAPRTLSDGYAIPDSVRTIGRYAFRWCNNLAEMRIPEGVTRIEERAFSCCKSLADITIPDSVSYIGFFAFEICNALTYTAYDNGKYLGNANNPYHTLVETVDTSITECSIHADTKVIAGAAFYECDALVSAVLPEGVVSIGERAFDCCAALTQITLPDSLRIIGGTAFVWCDALSEINIGENVTEIKPGAFTACTSLSGIWVDADNPAYCSDEQGVLYNKKKTVLQQAPCTISGSYAVADGVTAIEECAFYMCDSLLDVVLPKTVTKIGDSAFHSSGVTVINIPDGVTYIGTFAFSSSDITAIHIPNSVTYIGDGAFNNCYGLTEAVLSQSLTEIGPWVFRSCVKLAEITIPEGVTKIGYGAFESCSKLTQVTIPEGVTVIDKDAFASCTALTDVSIADSVVDIGTGAFAGCKKLNYSYTWRGDGKYLGNEHNPYFALMDVSDTDIEQFTVVEDTKVIAAGAFATCECMETVTLPDGLVAIGDNAFDGCAILSEITIPDTVTFIGDGAFQKCGFTEITIPGSVNYIGDSAFCDCQDLKAIRFCGQAPVLDKWVFNRLTTTVYCHTGHESWAKHIGRNYLGTITWAEGHVFLDYLPDEGFSCPVGGTKTARCEGCEQTDTVVVTDTAEHIYDMGKCSVCGEADPNGGILVGSLTSAGDAEATLTLYRDGEAVYTLTVIGSSYAWSSLQPGDYTLTVTKENHVPYSTAVTVAPGENTLDLVLCRPGDVVGIGDINIGDVAKIYAHAKGTSILEGYALACADVNGDGRVNVGDVAKLYARIKNADA